jgi:hypothetical protein
MASTPKLSNMNEYYNNNTPAFSGIIESHTFFTNLDNDLGIQFVQGLSPVWQDTFQKLQKNATFVAATRLDNYAKHWNELFSQEAGFPVLLASPTAMTPEKVAALKDDLNRCMAEFKQIRDRQSPIFQTVTDRVSVMLQVVAALSPDPGVKPMNKVSAHPGPDSAANQCPYAYVTVEGQQRRMDLSKHETPIQLSGLTLPLEIKVTEKPDPDAANATLFYTGRWDSWGALRLITSPNVRFEDGKWIVPLPVKNSDGSSAGHVDIELEFNPPLPPLDVWSKLTLAPP